MSEFHINVVIPKSNLWASIHRLLYPINLPNLLERHAKLHWFSVGERQQRLVWKLTNPFTRKELDEKDLEKFCKAIEVGGTPPTDSISTIRLGKFDDFYRDNEQLFLDLYIRHLAKLNKVVFYRECQRNREAIYGSKS
jgi:hypothetical protein